jgi:hypothetical protein
MEKFNKVAKAIAEDYNNTYPQLDINMVIQYIERDQGLNGASKEETFDYIDSLREIEGEPEPFTGSIGKASKTVSIVHVNRGQESENDVQVVYGNYARLGDIKVNEMIESHNEGFNPMYDDPSEATIESHDPDNLYERSALLDGIVLAVTEATIKYGEEDTDVVFNIHTDCFDYGSDTTYSTVANYIERCTTNKNWRFNLISSMSESDTEELKRELSITT